MNKLKELRLIVKMNERLGVETEQSVFDQIIAEEQKEQKQLALQEERKAVFKSTFADLSGQISKLMAEEKQKSAEEQALLDRFANVLAKIDDIKANAVSDEPQVTISEDLEGGQQVEDILEGIVELPEPEVIEEKAAILAPIEEPSLAKEAAKKIKKKDQPPSMFVQPAPEVTGRDLKDIQQKLKLLEGWVGKISMTGPGGGAVWLRDLDDVARSSVLGATDGQVLTYNESIKKWTAQDPTGGGPDGYVLPTASTTTKGGVKIDGTTITISNQVISANTSVDWLHVPSSIIPNTSLTYSLGNNTNRWESLWVGANSITFSDTLNGPDQTLSLSNQVFYITQGGGSNTTFNANAGFNAGGIILQNYTMQLANTTHDLVIGSASVNTSVIINQNLLVNTTITFSDTTTQNTAATQADWNEANTSKLSFIKNKPSVIAGANGTDGANGISVTAANVNSNGYLIITYSNTATANAGYVVGPAGANGSNVSQIQTDWNQSNTSAIDFIKNKPTIPTTIDSLTDVTITGPLNNQVLTYNTALSQWINQNGTSNNFTTGYFGGFIYTGANVALSNTANAYIVPLTSSQGASGISIGSNNNIIFAHAGTYELVYSIQIENDANEDDYADVWIRLNGANLADTNSVFAVNRKNTGGHPGDIIAVTPFQLTVAAGDSVQVMTSSSTGTAKIVTIPAQTNPAVPRTPGVIVNVQQVASIVIPDNISGTANNSLYLGGIAANQYAYANLTLSQLTNTTGNVALYANGTMSFPLDRIETGNKSAALWSSNQATVIWRGAGGAGLPLQTVVQSMPGYVNLGTATGILGGATTTYNWKFDTAGVMTFPDNSTQNTAWTGDVSSLTSNNALYLGTIAANQYMTLTGTQTVTNKTLTSPTISTPFASITAPEMGYTNNSTYAVDHNTLNTTHAGAPFSLINWHDEFAFGKLYPTITYETYNGTTWSSGTLNKQLFAQQQWSGGTVTAADGSTTFGSRWTFTGGTYGGTSYGAGVWLVLGHAWNSGTAPVKQVKVESSADGTTWATRHTSQYQTTMASVYHRIGDYGGDQYLRVTITWVSGNAINLANMLLLSARAGDQGFGREFMYPYVWDKDQNITVNANLAVTGVLSGTGTTQNVFNTTATTINFGGAATTMNIGAATGTTTIKNTLAVSNTATVTYTPATANGFAIIATGKDTQGGTGYFDFLRATNTTSGVTNGSKTFRLSSTGAVEIINSDYSATLLSLSNAGALSVPGPISISGKQAVNGPAFSAYANNTLQTITSGSQQKVLFQVEEFDTNSNYASSRFTPTVEGYYQLNAEVRLDGASGTGEMMIILYKNGSEYKRGTNQSGTQIATNFWAMQVSSMVYANGTGDYFEIYVQQGSGGNVTVTAVNNSAITWFNGCMLRGA